MRRVWAVNPDADTVTVINAATGAMPLEGIYYPISSSGLVTASWTAINHSTGGNHVTDQSWPTALPGTAVGYIPQ